MNINPFSVDFGDGILEDFHSLTIIVNVDSLSQFIIDDGSFLSANSPSNGISNNLTASIILVSKAIGIGINTTSILFPKTKSID